MCGILGAFQVGEGTGLVRRFDAGIRSLKHRGPDARCVEAYEVAGGFVRLGHTRLSIIDLTDGGLQPMHGSEGRYVIVFNGEIYNYKELRQELQVLGHQFTSESDTEVLLAALTVWGQACLPRLVGMFAFAVLDRQKATLTCVRDAFGIKPFFYTQEGTKFSFASELPALVALNSTKPQPNWQRAYDYLVHGEYDSGPDTFFEGIKQLMPGHLLTVDLERGRVADPERWWTASIVERTDLSFGNAVDLVRTKFLQNIRLHLRSDVPLGAALSGGIDSSAVVCAMRYIEPKLPIHTFSFIASGSDVNEEHWVDRVNDHIGAIAHKVHVTADELAADLDDMITSQGEPFGSTSIYAQYRVFKLAREQGITVTLDGQGADELLAGYNGYPGQRLRSLIETGHIYEACKFLNQWAQWPGRSRVHGLKALVGQLTEGSLYAVLRKLNGDQHRPAWLNEQVLREGGVFLSYPNKAPEVTLRGRRVVAELAASLTQRGLSALLRHGDRNSMRFSVESRVPFLTTDLADLLLSMPEDYLIAPNGETKRVFRAAMRGIVPDDVLARKDKIGFATPEKDWLMSMAPTIRKWLSVPIDLPFINQSALLREFDQVVNGARPFNWQVWRWISFTRWYQKNFISSV